MGGSSKYIDPIKSNGRDDDQSNGLAILFCNNGVPISSSSSTSSSSKRCYLVPLARLIAVGLMLMDTGVIVIDAITMQHAGKVVCTVTVLLYRYQLT